MHSAKNDTQRPRGISAVAEIVAEVKAGRMVVLVDAEDRENEGDLVIAAEHATPQAINFMARYGRGLVCLTLTQKRCEQLDLPLMATRNRSHGATNFTVSIDASTGISAGISAADRATTIRAAIHTDARPSDLVRPGHVFPLMARSGGVLERAGHTEAACDLALLAGTTPAAVICEIMKDDGNMARLPDLLDFAAMHSLKIGTIADLIAYRTSVESLVVRIAECDLRTLHGDFRLVAFEEKLANATHLALVKGSIEPAKEILVRVNEGVSSVIDLLEFGGQPHSWTLDRALATINRAGCGVVVLLYCEEAATKLVASIEQRHRHESAVEQSPMRNYGIGAQILRELGVGKMRLLTLPRKMPNMKGFGLHVTGYLGPDKEDVASAKALVGGLPA